jgi:hypothetical protein
MKWSMLVLAVVLFSVDAQAEEKKYEVTGVFCKKYADLHNAITGMYTGVHFLDALQDLHDCFVITKHPVKIEAQFVAWLPAVWQKAFIYKGNHNEPVMLDNGGLVSSSSGKWFFIPSAASNVPQPTQLEQMRG